MIIEKRPIQDSIADIVRSSAEFYTKGYDVWKYSFTWPTRRWRPGYREILHAEGLKAARKASINSFDGAIDLCMINASRGNLRPSKYDKDLFLVIRAHHLDAFSRHFSNSMKVLLETFSSNFNDVFRLSESELLSLVSLESASVLYALANSKKSLFFTRHAEYLRHWRKIDFAKAAKILLKLKNELR